MNPRSCVARLRSRPCHSRKARIREHHDAGQSEAGHLRSPIGRDGILLRRKAGREIGVLDPDQRLCGVNEVRDNSVAKTWKFAVRRLIVVKFIAVSLLSTILLGGTLPRAMTASIVRDPCQTAMVASWPHATATSRVCSGTLTKAPMPGDCAKMLECAVGSAFGIPHPASGLVVREGNGPVYWAGISLLAGRAVPPDLSPPILLV